jgi:hypothetical protein
MEATSNVVTLPVRPRGDPVAARLKAVTDRLSRVLDGHRPVRDMNDLVEWATPQLLDEPMVARVAGLIENPYEVAHRDEPKTWVLPLVVDAANGTAYLVTALKPVMPFEPPCVRLGLNDLPLGVFGFVVGVLHKKNILYHHDKPELRLQRWQRRRLFG